MISLVCVGLFWGDLERLTQMESTARGLIDQRNPFILAQAWDKREKTALYKHKALYINTYP